MKKMLSAIVAAVFAVVAFSAVAAPATAAAPAASAAPAEKKEAAKPAIKHHRKAKKADAAAK
jgi:hypothetical protein